MYCKKSLPTQNSVKMQSFKRNRITAFLVKSMSVFKNKIEVTQNKCQGKPRKFA